MTITGTVKCFDSERGFGFVVSNAVPSDVFLHAIVVHALHLGSLPPGATVEAEVVKRPDGRWRVTKLLSVTVRA
jgi:CspA family cold shock protein